MQNNRDIFTCFDRSHSECLDDFEIKPMQFLQDHQKSFKQLDNLLATQQNEDKENSSMSSNKIQQIQEDDEAIDLRMQIQLKRFTSFESDFMEAHRNVLKKTILAFRQNFGQNELQCLSSSQNQLGVKQLLFSKELFSNSEIRQNKQFFSENIQNYKILKQTLSSLSDLNVNFTKDALLITTYLLKKLNPVVEQIKRFNDINIEKVLKIVEKLLQYIKSQNKLTILQANNSLQKPEIKTQKKQRLMAQTWIYTLLIAKLGYFQNDSFDREISLAAHLVDLSKKLRRQYLLEDQLDSEENSVQLQSQPSKKIKY